MADSVTEADIDRLLKREPRLIEWTRAETLNATGAGQVFFGPPIDVLDWEVVLVELIVMSNSGSAGDFTFGVQTCIDAFKYPKWSDTESADSSVPATTDGHVIITVGGPLSVVPIRRWLRWRVTHGVAANHALMATIRATRTTTANQAEVVALSPLLVELRRVRDFFRSVRRSEPEIRAELLRIARERRPTSAERRTSARPTQASLDRVQRFLGARGVAVSASTVDGLRHVQVTVGGVPVIIASD